MKKLRFIIPVVLNRKQFFCAKSMVILLGLSILAVDARADSHDYGCRVGERIFQNLDLMHPGPTNFQGDSDGNGHPNGFAVVNDRCDNGETTPCTVYEFDEINIYGTGYLADFSMDYCPIDDYLPAMIIFIISVVVKEMIARNHIHP